MVVKTENTSAATMEKPSNPEHRTCDLRLRDPRPSVTLH